MFVTAEHDYTSPVAHCEAMLIKDVAGWELASNDSAPSRMLEEV